MRGTRSGFTLLELLAVMAVIAILAGLGAKGYTLARRQAKESRALADLEKLRTAFNEYRVEYGRYPACESATEVQTLAAAAFLTNAVEDISMVDPWGRAYVYVCSNRFLYSIWSEGQDADSAHDNLDPASPGY